MNGIATGFPLARSMQTKNMDKTIVQQLFSSSESSLATENLGSRVVQYAGSEEQEGPAAIAAAGTFTTGKPTSKDVSWSSAIPSGPPTRFIDFQRKQRPGLERDELAVIRRRLDLDSSQTAGRPPAYDDQASNALGAHLQPVPVAPDRGAGRRFGLVAEAVARRHEESRSHPRCCCAGRCSRARCIGPIVARRPKPPPEARPRRPASST